jgi:hypothetical protein
MGCDNNDCDSGAFEQYGAAQPPPRGSEALEDSDVLSDVMEIFWPLGTTSDQDAQFDKQRAALKKVLTEYFVPLAAATAAMTEGHWERTPPQCTCAKETCPAFCPIHGEPRYRQPAPPKLERTWNEKQLEAELYFAEQRGWQSAIEAAAQALNSIAYRNDVDSARVVWDRCYEAIRSLRPSPAPPDGRRAPQCPKCGSYKLRCHNNGCTWEIPSGAS